MLFETCLDQPSSKFFPLSEQSALMLDLDLVVRDHHLRSSKPICSCGRAGLGLCAYLTEETITRSNEIMKNQMHELRQSSRQFSNSSQGSFVDKDDRRTLYTCQTRSGVDDQFTCRISRMAHSKE
jgi:hypothetical protein